MSDRERKDSSGEFEQALKEQEHKHYVLRLYVAGLTPKSTRAVESIKRLCETELKGRYELEVVDIYQHPGAAAEEQIVALPTLIKRLPLPLRKFIGDLSDNEKMIVGLDLQHKDGQEQE